MRKVLLTLEDGVIVAKKYSFVTDERQIGVKVLCDDGTFEAFVDELPSTQRDYFGIDITDTATYAEKRTAILEATGWEEVEFEELEIDRYGNVLPDKDAAITQWLNSKISDDQGDSWAAFTAGQYAPGFSMLGALEKNEITKLGLREADIGGMASGGVWSVSTTATIEELNAVLEQKGLPFIFVDDEGSSEV